MNDIEKAIAYFKNCVVVTAEGNDSNLIRRVTIQALEEKLERENPRPLTEYELRQMNGQPVWIITQCGIFACIVQITRHRGQFRYITLVHDTHFVFTPNNGIVYKYPPKEV